MRAFLIFFTGLLLTTIPAFSQISDFPYNQGFEDPFIAFGSNVEFKDDWTGNHVNNNNTRIFRSEKFIRSGRYALAVQPISSFDGVFTIELDLSGYDLIRLHFYARSAKNGSGSRPVLARISTSVDGGANFIKRENIGNETTFPNQDTDFALYIYDLPPSAASQQKVLIKFEIMYASAFGEGTAALFLLDDLSIYEKEEDVKIIEVSPLNANTLQLIFNQEVDETSAETLENYTIEPFNSIISAKRNPLSKNSISLQFENTFYKGNNKLSVKNIYNIDNSNHLEEQAFSFSYIPPPSIPGFNELLITEIMADPDPSAGLPVSEYFELYNPTSKTLTLKNIEFSDATSSTKFPDMVIESEKYLVAVPNNKIELFEGIAPVIGLSPWPSLNVGGDQLSLTSSEGKLIFSVNYNKSWYKNPIKSEGGWSLEMIYTKNPCGGIENWAASINNLGGTPGYENSIAANQPDVSLPRLSSAIALSEDKILLKFDKKIQPDINDLSSFSILPQLEIQSAEIQVPELNAILLTLSDSLNHHSIYEIFVNNLNDCAGNPIDINFNSAVFSLPDLADSMDIIINEVLFNPRTGGVKFIEIYNKSEKFINLKNWHLGNELDIQNSSIKLLSNEDFIIEPKSFLAISQDSEKLKSEYPKGKEDRFL
ncbi:MAG: lamin tail domain-containing protein, partial [Bacteroidota bacterium]|nr:lamin tail domain-containing protein [Bacteroidota bacterium]